MPMRDLSRRTFVQTVVASGAAIMAESLLPTGARAAGVHAMFGGQGGGGYTFKPVNFEGGGFVTGMVIHPTSGVPYIRTDVGGLYRGDVQSGGSYQWTKLLDALTVPAPLLPSDYNVSSIAIAPTDPSILYMSAGNYYPPMPMATSDTGRLLKSTDNGTNWTVTGPTFQTSGNGQYRMGAERLAVDPANENVVYFGSDNDGLWATTNGGSSWSQVSTIPAAAYPGVRFVLFDSTSGTLNGKTKIIYAGVAGTGVYVSLDAGASWALDSGSPSGNPCDAKMGYGGQLYVSYWSVTSPSYLGNLYKRASANSYTVISPGSASGSYLFGVNPGNSNTPDTLITANYALQTSNFYRSETAGESWSTLAYTTYAPGHWLASTGQAAFMSIGTFVFDPLVPGKVWFPEGFGVWYSSSVTGSKVTWAYESVGIQEMVTQDAVVSSYNGQPYLVTAVSDWSGFTQTTATSGTGSLAAPPSQPNLATTSALGCSVSCAVQNPAFVVAIASKTSSPYQDFSGYSINGGQTWTQFSSPGSESISTLRCGCIAVSALTTSSLLWAPGSISNGQPQVPYYSSDQGTHWTPLTNTFSHYIGGLIQQHQAGSQRCLDSDKVNDNVFYVFSMYINQSNQNGYFFVSAGGGADNNWTIAPYAPPSSTALSGPNAIYNQLHAVPGNAGHVWISTAAGLYYTTNAGQSPFTQVGGITWCGSFGFGAAVHTYPAIYANCTIGGVQGLYTSADMGSTWTLIAQYPANCYNTIQVVKGDLYKVGRVYVGFIGNSFVYGDSD